MKCKLCGGDSHLIHTGTRDNPNIDVYECESCQVKFLSDIRENDYEHDFMYQTDNLQNMTPEECLKSCKTDDARRSDMLKDYLRDLSVLDFGCGYGGFLSNIQCFAKECYGVELGIKERNFLNSIGIECKRQIEDYGDKRFDAITLFHVFEHLTEPDNWINRYADYLNRGGYLILEVPNGNDVLLSLYESQAFADFTYWSPHQFLYNEKNLVKMIDKSGFFEPVEIGFYQRYPIANHLMWLAKGKPGGQNLWTQFNDSELMTAYENVLKQNKMSDTIFQIWRKK